MVDRKKFNRWKKNAINKWGGLLVDEYWEKLYEVAFEDGVEYARSTKKRPKICKCKGGVHVFSPHTADFVCLTCGGHKPV